MFVLFFLLWILMAGELSVHTCLWGLAASALMTWFCRKVLDYRWHLEFRSLGSAWTFVRYIVYLVKEMLKAGFVVMRLIYTRGRNMRPKLIYFDTPLQSDRLRALLANSITLTAGTITVSAEDGHFCVHTLDASLAEDIEKSVFQEKIAKLEEQV